VKRAYIVALVLALVAGLAVTVAAKDNPPTTRLLTGKVLDRSDSPMANAVVYLTNTKTRAVKTYIAGRDGEFRFPALSPNVDYEVYAQFEGRKSDVKTVSQFDSRMEVNINLRIDMK